MIGEAIRFPTANSARPDGRRVRRSRDRRKPFGSLSRPAPGPSKLGTGFRAHSRIGCYCLDG